MVLIAIPLLVIVPSSHDMSYSLCLSATFLQHGYIQMCFLFLFYDLYVLHVLCSHSSSLPPSPLPSPLLSLSVGVLPSLLSGCFLFEPWDSLSDYVHPGIACLAFQALIGWVHSWVACLVF